MLFEHSTNIIIFFSEEFDETTETQKETPTYIFRNFSNFKYLNFRYDTSVPLVHCRSQTGIDHLLCGSD